MTDQKGESPLALTRTQRSHVLIVLSNANTGDKDEFLNWYQGPYRNALSDIAGMLSVQHYERHHVDITRGAHVPLPFQYLGFLELSIDGASAAIGLIDEVTRLHNEQPTAQAPATWLYYPVSEKVGRTPTSIPSMLTLAFANGVAGQELEFREWYATRHIRHALNISALVSGQCLERTQFQKEGALPASFHTIAVYEQEGEPEEILKSFSDLPQSTFHFPMLDLSRFAESVYRPLQSVGSVPLQMSSGV
jgi:hypothetical protein